jgi:hypothetical protein
MYWIDEGVVGHASDDVADSFAKLTAEA